MVIEEFTAYRGERGRQLIDRRSLVAASAGAFLLGIRWSARRGGPIRDARR